MQLGQLGAVRELTDPNCANCTGINTEKRPSDGPNWDEGTARLVAWFLTTDPPSAPFILHLGVSIARPVRFWHAIRTDIAVGPGKARAYYGALQKDLRRLAELYGGPSSYRKEAE